MKEITSETLYRKHRPESFDGVRGQEEVVSTLQNSIKNGSIAHSYLFSGTRGTGKTSVARIFANELGTSPEDVYEIDAASNRGINEIRELRAGVDTRPFTSAYKVYIIDEVHMLTKEAGNALLKTLEEPPSHVIFILATTEKHKILDTIISRCQVFDFRRPTKAQLTEFVQEIAKEEKRKIDQESAEYVAELGNGSFRDTLSHLQGIFSYFKKDITFKELSETRSLSEVNLLWSFLDAINEGDKDSAFSVYHQVKDSYSDASLFIKDVLEAIRRALLVRYSKSFKEHMDLEAGGEKVARLEGYTNLNSKHLQDILEVVSKFDQGGNPEVLFELYLFELFKEKDD